MKNKNENQNKRGKKTERTPEKIKKVRPSKKQLK